MKTKGKESESAPEIRIGISSCLLGKRVRFDGGHKRDEYINETLSRFVRFVPVCPEMDIGLGTPRESLRLVRQGKQVRMIGQKSQTDHTAAMERYSRQKAVELAEEDLCGYIFKKDSPSCGIQRVRLYDHNGVPSRTGRGLFADAILSRHPPRSPATGKFLRAGICLSKAEEPVPDALARGRSRSISHRRKTAPHGPRSRGVQQAG